MNCSSLSEILQKIEWPEMIDLLKFTGIAHKMQEKNVIKVNHSIQPISSYFLLTLKQEFTGLDDDESLLLDEIKFTLNNELIFLYIDSENRADISSKIRNITCVQF